MATERKIPIKSPTSPLPRRAPLSIELPCPTLAAVSFQASAHFGDGVGVRSRRPSGQSSHDLCCRPRSAAKSAVIEPHAAFFKAREPRHAAARPPLVAQESVEGKDTTPRMTPPRPAPNARGTAEPSIRRRRDGSPAAGFVSSHRRAKGDGVDGVGGYRCIGAGVEPRHGVDRKQLEHGEACAVSPRREARHVGHVPNPPVSSAAHGE